MNLTVLMKDCTIERCAQWLDGYGLIMPTNLNFDNSIEEWELVHTPSLTYVELYKSCSPTKEHYIKLLHEIINFSLNLNQRPTIYTDILLKEINHDKNYYY